MNLKKKILKIVKSNDVVDLMPTTIFKNKNIFRITCDGDPEYVKEFETASSAIKEAWEQSNIGNFINYLSIQKDPIKKLDQIIKNEEDKFWGITIDDIDNINKNIYSKKSILDTINKGK